MEGKCEGEERWEKEMQWKGGEEASAEGRRRDGRRREKLKR